MNVFEAQKNPGRQDEYPATDARRESDLWLAFRSPGRISRERSGDRGLESESADSEHCERDEKPALSLSLSVRDSLPIWKSSFVFNDEKKEQTWEWRK